MNLCHSETGRCNSLASGALGLRIGHEPLLGSDRAGMAQPDGPSDVVHLPLPAGPASMANDQG